MAIRKINGVRYMPADYEALAVNFPADHPHFIAPPKKVLMLKLRNWQSKTGARIETYFGWKEYPRLRPRPRLKITYRNLERDLRRAQEARARRQSRSRRAAGEPGSSAVDSADCALPSIEGRKGEEVPKRRTRSGRWSRLPLRYRE